MEQKKTCPLCETECEIYSISPLQQLFTIDCPICGKYNLTDRAKEHLNSRKNSFYIISGITRNFYELHKDTGDFFVIKWEMIRDDAKFQAEFVSKAPKDIFEKASLLLQYIHRKSNYSGDKVLIIPSQDYTLCFCKNAKELIFHINNIRDLGDIKADGTMRDYSLSLTAEGWRKIESLNKPNTESRQVFVAMWFDKSMDEIFAGGIKAIEKEVGFNMFRVDKTHFIDEKICDKIITEIKKSRFLIADVTGHRQAVYFEAGYAMAMGLPVIWTCKKEETEVENCCFDTRQYPHIFWKDAENLRIQLKEKILATISKAEK